MNEKNLVYIYKNKKDNYKAIIFEYDRWFSNMYHLASFSNIEQLQVFLKRFKIKLIKKDIYNKGKYNEVNVYRTNKLLVNNSVSFWDLNEIPKNAKKIKALSNGNIVDCYYTNSKNVLKIYRPNPNAKNVYKPLSTEQYILYHKKFGIL